MAIPSGSSGRKQGSKILGIVDRGEAESVLVEWANLPDVPAGCGGKVPQYLRLLSRHADMFGHLDENLTTMLNLRDLRDLLRKTWDSPDRWHREWYAHELHRAWNAFSPMLLEESQTITQGFPGGPQVSTTTYTYTVLEVPPITPMGAVIHYFKTVIGDRAKHCLGPDCSAPYFIAPKRQQKYCSEICAGPANREAKRKWWHENRGGGLL